MNPSLDELMTRRASLRTKYDEAVSKLLQALDSHPKPTYSRDDLTKLRITLGTFNPDIPSFGTSLFEPMSPEKLAGFSLKMSEQSQNTQNLHNRYDELYNRLPDQAGIVGYRQPNGREADIFYRNLESTSSYLGRLYKGSYKRTRRSHEFLTDTSKWTQLADGNPFEELPVGFLGGYSPNAQIPRWYVEANYEWQDNPRDPSTIRPHMMLVVRTGAIAVVGELLFCELACIAQVIKNRLQQEDFTRTSLFPVGSYTI
ncbi:hypothetical protein N7539_003835 [Penicillium diatomitis]|uniref:Uncharacterized protein n=1 Tax=Penicillium diatomitis TaxID=2819901 RepID=A0A9W9XCP6_9EURO|nr:uncharacterized protein N7539_003835 [Penicillium diatomitis]KAJ5488945.1 hypothetical protein N7539_003835 [Penicillium diatomitis]